MPKLDNAIGVGTVIPHNGDLFVVIDWQICPTTGDPYWICENNFGKRIHLTDVQLCEDENDLVYA